MEQQIITVNDVELEVQVAGNPLVVISEPITSEVVSIDSEANVKVITEESAVLLVLTEGGSLYKKAVADGYSGTELEWLTELLDSKASVQFVVTTIADSNTAYASALLALEAEIGDSYVSNIRLSEVIAERDLARALDKQILEAKIDTDIQASYTSIMDVMVTENLAIATRQTELEAELGVFNSKVSSVEQAIATETSARTLAINSMSSSLNGRIDAEIVTINQTIVDETSSLAQQITNLDSSFNGLLTSSINTVNTAITTETTARAQQIEVLRVDFTTGMSAVLTEIQEVKIDIDGNTLAIDSVTAIVTNPITGLSATFTRANQAYTLANDTAGAFSIIEGKVNNPTTGLAATYAFAQQVEINAANNTSTAINSLRNEITAPNASWVASNTFIQSIKTTSDNNTTAITSLSSSIGILDGNLVEAINDIDTLNGTVTTVDGKVTALENWKINTATVQLSTHTNQLGDLESRAFIGVISTSGGKATVAGLTVNSTNYSLSFQGNIFELVNTAGTQQLYYDSSVGQWKFSGELVAATFKTATSGYRAEMDGVSGFPFWYGTGTKNSANGIMYVDTAGNLTAKHASLIDAIIQGRLVTDSGSGIRTEVYDDGTYLIWIGSGAKNDVNGIFWIKRNGTGFIKGDFFSGQIIETRMGSYSSPSINGAIVSAGTHNSAGKPVEITANCSVSLTMAGNTESSLLIIAGNIRRNGAFVATVQSVIGGYWDFETNTTLYTGGFNRVAVDTRSVEEARDYDVVFYVPQFPIGSVNSAQTDITIRTFENKLE